jgi:hypothetical protein
VTLEFGTKSLTLILLGLSQKEKAPSKNKRMLLFVARTRYSLVKGERIVRFVLTTQLRTLSGSPPAPICSRRSARPRFSWRGGTKPQQARQPATSLLSLQVAQAYIPARLTRKSPPSPVWFFSLSPPAQGARRARTDDQSPSASASRRLGFLHGTNEQTTTTTTGRI